MSDKWTKKDIRLLTSQIDTFWLTIRPLTLTASAMLASSLQLEHSLKTARKEIVLRGLRSAREASSHRYSQECETIGNALVRGIYGDGTTAFVEKWVADARETDKAHAALEALVLRVHHGDLPPEVMSYHPCSK